MVLNMWRKEWTSNINMLPLPCTFKQAEYTINREKLEVKSVFKWILIW